MDLTKSVPYPSLGHIAEAILHYGNSSDQPSSTMYFNIAQSYNLDCLKTKSCVAINCPFINYNQNYNITQCIKLTDLQLLLPTPEDKLPGKPTQTIFFNFGFHGDGSSSKCHQWQELHTIQHATSNPRCESDRDMSGGL